MTRQTANRQTTIVTGFLAMRLTDLVQQPFEDEDLRHREQRLPVRSGKAAVVDRLAVGIDEGGCGPPLPLDGAGGDVVVDDAGLGETAQRHVDNTIQRAQQFGEVAQRAVAAFDVAVGQQRVVGEVADDYVALRDEDAAEMQVAVISALQPAERRGSKTVDVREQAIGMFEDACRRLPVGVRQPLGDAGQAAHSVSCKTKNVAFPAPGGSALDRDRRESVAAVRQRPVKFAHTPADPLQQG